MPLTNQTLNNQLTYNFVNSAWLIEQLFRYGWIFYTCTSMTTYHRISASLEWKQLLCRFIHRSGLHRRNQWCSAFHRLVLEREQLTKLLKDSQRMLLLLFCFFHKKTSHPLPISTNISWQNACHFQGFFVFLTESLKCLSEKFMNE